MKNCTRCEELESRIKHLESLMDRLLSETEAEGWEIESSEDYVVECYRACNRDLKTIKWFTR